MISCLGGKLSAATGAGSRSPHADQIGSPHLISRLPRLLGGDVDTNRDEQGLLEQKIPVRTRIKSHVLDNLAGN